MGNVSLISTCEVSRRGWSQPYKTWPSSSSNQEFVRNANYWAPTWTYSIRNWGEEGAVSVIVSLPGESDVREKQGERDLQDGGGVRRGDHLPPHKYIRNTSTCGTTPTEHLLNAGRRPRTSQKARNSPRTWVGQKKKEKTETKE